MTPSERERRIEAATHAFAREIDCIPMPNTPAFDGFSRRAERILNAADEAVPMIPVTSLPIQGRNAGLLGLGARYEGHALDPAKLTLYYATGPTALERAERAEAAAKDFAKALAFIAEHEDDEAWLACRVPQVLSGMARGALDRHPAFSGEEGAET